MRGRISQEHGQTEGENLDTDKTEGIKRSYDSEAAEELKSQAETPDLPVC